MDESYSLTYARRSLDLCARQTRIAIASLKYPLGLHIASRTAMGVLDGVRVLDLSRLMPGPLCTMILGDLGADVIKVEQPEVGDYARSAPPFIKDTGAVFAMLNRNKRSITLNLKTKEAREVAHKLAETVQVFVESFQPGVSDRLGVGYETISRINKGIVYCSISGFGQTGPYRDLVGHDLTYTAYSGVIGTTGLEGGPPVIPPLQVADIQGGIYAALAIMAALYRREKTGEGEFIDISLVDAAVASMVLPLSFHFAGFPTERGTLPLSGTAPFYTVYETADRQFIAVAPLEPNFWRKLCKTLGVEKYEDRQIAIGDEARRIHQDLASLFQGKSREAWIGILNEHGIPCAPVYDVPEVLQDPQVMSRSMIFRMESQEFGSLNQIATPIRFSKNPLTARLRPPKLGEHTLDILDEVGYSAGDAERLAAVGAI